MKVKFYLGAALIANILVSTFTTPLLPTGLRIAIPLVPIWVLQGTPGLITSGLAAAALLKLKAGAVTALYLGLRDGINANVGVDTNLDTASFSHGGGHGGGYGGGEAAHGGYSSGGHGGHGQQGLYTTIGGGIGPHGLQAQIGGGYNRKKRDVNGGNPVPIQVTYDPSLDDVLQYDQLGCGLRLVCELSSTPEESLQNDEKLILNLFGRELKAPKVDASRGRLSYSYAALLGETAKSSETCGKVYFRCPYNSRSVMESLREAQL